MNTQQHIAIIGAGTIGKSWTALFLAKGHRVTVFDVQEGIEERLRRELPGMLRNMPGGKTYSDDEIEALVANLSVVGSIEEAVSTADAIQENGPEILDFKQGLFQQIEQHACANALILSSSSGIQPERSGAKMSDPNRLVIGHPFNPPHIIPLVEVCGTPDVNDELIKRVMQFYESLGKSPVRLNKPIAGFVANRLQFVLAIEASRIVNEGVVSMEGLDRIMTSSLGIRWASIGPLLAFKINGGDGGIGKLFGVIMKSMAEGMGYEGLSDNEIAQIHAAAEAAYPADKMPELIQHRDQMQNAVIQLSR
ncbi:MAG: 3-hydroxyacyl-CoA dehydrogenase NAD-binding domain-containing protein [Planctomycetaceae bacterium]